MKKFKFICYSILSISGASICKAQDPIFTQFYANPLYLNPAMAGITPCPKATLNYRLEWPNINGTYKTYSFAYDQNISLISGGIGLLIMQDDAGNGILKHTTISGIYSYLLNLKRFSIKMGLQGTYFQKSIDWSKLTFGDMIDPRTGFIYNTQEETLNSTKSGFDISTGAIAYNNIYYAGLALSHINRPDEGLTSYSQLPIKIVIHGGAKIPIGIDLKEIFLSPNILYRRQQNFNELNIGLYGTRGPIVGGMWYRGLDAFILLLGIQKNQIKIGYSYDVTVSKLASATGGSHEISSTFTLKCKPKKVKHKKVSCPSF